MKAYEGIRFMNLDIRTLWEKFSDVCVEYALRILGVIIILIVGKMLIRFLMKHSLKGKVAEKVDPSIRNYIRTSIKFVLNIILIVICVAILGVPVASIIAVFATVGAAIVLAMQGSLSNVASGIVLLITRPFRLNDWITAGERTGEVVELGLFYTTIRTIENLDIIIPNSELTTAVIINLTREAERRSNFTVKVAYGTDTELVRKTILEFAAQDPRILKDPEPFCAMNAMSDSSIDFIVRFWCKKDDYWPAYFDFQEGLYNELTKKGIQIPFNQIDVHIVS